MLFCKPGWARGRRGWGGTLSAGHPNTMATSLIMFSTISRPWGTPKPLKAVFDGRLVLHAVPRPRRLGMLYAVSMWRTIFSATCKHHKIHSYVLWRFTYIYLQLHFLFPLTKGDSSTVLPLLAKNWKSAATIFPSFMKPTWNKQQSTPRMMTNTSQQRL